MYLSLLSIKFNRKNRSHYLILSRKMVRKWNAQHGRGSRSRGKKMLIFRSARYPKRSRAVCITLLPHARISNAPLVFFTRRGGGRGGAGGRFTNKRRRLNVQGEWPAIWRPPFETATPQKRKSRKCDYVAF